MFIIHTSNRTERLAECLASMLSQRSSASIFRKELFLIQSRGMERMLSQFLAEYFGVWCNSDYLLPIQFIDYLCNLTAIAGEDQILNRDLLTWKLEGILRNNDVPVLRPLADYLSGDQSDLKRFQLARQLADVFDQYQIMRMDILEAWASDRRVSDDAAEGWQKELWRRILAASPGAMHRGELVKGLITNLDGMDIARADFPERMFVFGLHTMPPLFLSVLNRLSETIDVHLFLLSPCEHYWGDIESSRSRGRRILSARTSLHPIPDDDMPYHPLLAAFGRQGAHFQEMLLDKIDAYQDGEASFADPLAAAGSAPFLLHRLQSDILAGSEPEKNACLGAHNDGSIQVVSCHSRMRELMVLRDQIISWMHEEQRPDLHEIIVMAPDIQDYALMVPAVFEDIQHTIADRNVRMKNSYFDTFMKFLGLLSGRYGWTELVGILERPEVFPQFSLSAGDLETIRHWVIEAGIRWGLSARQRVLDNFIDSEAGTWLAGLERMLMGYTIDSDEPVAGVLPFTAIEGGNGELLGGLCRFVDVVDQSCLSFAADKTLAEWSVELQSLCSALFAEPENPDLLALSRIISELEEKYSRFHNDSVSFEVVETWLQSVVETGSSGGFLSGRLSFCSMLPMRSVPFRIICLLGLNDGEYPKQDYQPTFNLAARDYRHGDRSNRADDRYQFLEAIISARERLYLSYIGQSIRTNKNIPPSVVVSELLDCLQLHYGVDDPTVHHPLQPYDWKYFTGSDGLFSYDAHFCRVAANLQKPGEVSGKSWLPVVPVKRQVARYDFLDFVRFVSQPQVYFVRHILGINLAGEELLPDDDELFKLDGLSRYGVEQEIVGSILQGADSRMLLARMQAESRWMLGTPGLIAFEKEVTQLSAFVQRISAFNPGGPVDAPYFELVLDGIIIEGNLPHCYQNGQLLYRYAPLKGKDLLAGWLCHLVAARIRSQKLATFIVSSDYTVVFDVEMGKAEDLEFLASLFVDGCSRVSSLLVEPAFSYAQQHRLNQARGKKKPIDAARQLFLKSFENNHVPEWNLLYRNLNDEAVLNNDFEAVCTRLMVPLWECGHILDKEHWA